MNTKLTLRFDEHLIESARHAEAGYIITGNIKNFKKSTIPAYTATEFLSMLEPCPKTKAPVQVWNQKLWDTKRVWLVRPGQTGFVLKGQILGFLVPAVLFAASGHHKCLADGLFPGKIFKKIHCISGHKGDELDIIFNDQIGRFCGNGTANENGNLHLF
jgi:hypothetical protein